MSIRPNAKPALRYYIFRLPDVPVPVLELFERHFGSFQLKRDMASEGATLVETFVQEIIPQRVQPFTPPQLERAIAIKLDGLRHYPTNSWEVATFEGLQLCADFLGYFNALAPAPIEQPARINRRALLENLRQAAGR